MIVYDILGTTEAVVPLSALERTPFEDRTGTIHVQGEEDSSKFLRLLFHDEARILANTNALVSGHKHDGSPFKVIVTIIKDEFASFNQ